MLDPKIVNEAYDEINISQLKEDVDGGQPKEMNTPKLDPKIERIRKLISDIQNIIYKLQDEYDDKYGKEDNDLRDEMKKALSKTMYKMVDRLKDVLEDKEDKEEDKKEEKEDKKESNFFKLFPTESVISPQGKEYKIIEINENKSLIEDGNGEKFKVDTNILKMWKNK